MTNLEQAHALEHAAMLIAHMDERAMRSAIIWHKTHQEQIAGLLNAAKALRLENQSELRSLTDAAENPPQGRTP